MKKLVGIAAQHMRNNVRRQPIFLMAFALISLPFRSAEPQTLVDIMHTDSLDWAAYASNDSIAIASAVEAAGLCKVYEGSFTLMPFYHLVDLTGDNTEELIYSGPRVGCDWASEGATTTVYSQTGGRWSEVFHTEEGYVIDIVPDPPQAAALTLRDPGCCGDPYVSIGIWLPNRRPNETPKWVLSGRVMWVWALQFPSVAKSNPRRFRIAGPEFDVRYSPFYENEEERLLIPGHRGNGFATYGEGATGTAFAEQIDESGRRWWFVVMDPGEGLQAMAGIDDEHLNELQRYNRVVGWMSSQFLEEVPTFELPSN